MANYVTLKAAIQAAIKQNGNNEITGNLLQAQLLSMVNSLGVGYQFMGIAYPQTTPSVEPDQRIYYIAGPGVYPNFGNLEVAADEVALLVWTTAWEKQKTNIAPIELTGGSDAEQLISGVIFPSADNVVRVITLQDGEAPVTDTLVSFFWETNASPVTKISFFSDTSYTLITEFDVTYNGQVVLFPAATKLIAIRFQTGNTLLRYSLVSGTIACKLHEINTFNSTISQHVETLDARGFKSFGAFENMTIPNSNLYKGYVSLDDGSFITHSNRICTDFIFVGNGLGIDFFPKSLSQAVAYIQMFVVAYKDYYGERQFSRVLVNGKYNGAVGHLHDDEDCVRMWCVFQNSSWQTVSNPDVSLFNAHVEIYTQSYERMQQSNIIDVGRRLELRSDNGVEWLVGDYSNFMDTRRSISNYLRVKEGHRYMVTAKSVGMISAVVYAMFDKDMTETDATVGYNSGTPIYNAVVDIPKGVRYLNVSLVLYQALSGHEFNIDDYNVVIYDTTFDGVRFGTKELTYIRSTARYAQGADIDAGYIFQAFSDGTIDVYRLSDKAFVQTLTMPAAIGGGMRHLGVIKFGEKYDSSDRFGLLWLGGEAGIANTVAVRITGTDGNLVCSTIYDLADNAYTGDVLGFDFDNMRIFRSAYTTQPTPGQYQSSIGYPQISIYNVSEWTSDGTQTLAKTFNINDCYAVQMMQPIGNMIYAPVGVGTNAINLFAINTITEKVEQIIDMTQFGIPIVEPQCVFFDSGRIYLATVTGLWCLNNL